MDRGVVPAYRVLFQEHQQAPTRGTWRTRRPVRLSPSLSLQQPGRALMVLSKPPCRQLEKSSNNDYDGTTIALNWAMLTEDGRRPVPLPHEKVFFSVEKCSLALEFKNQSLKWSATGSAFVTNERIIFVRQPPLPTPASADNTQLSTLSVPLPNFLDTRYLITIFAAPVYEATIIPTPDGGLPQPSRSSGMPTTGLLKLWFTEGGGMQFRDAIEEVKSRREEGARQFEALPTYEPPEEGSSTEQQQGVSPAPRLAPARAPVRRDSQQPDAEDMAAASVARDHEERERDAIPGQDPPLAHASSSSSPTAENHGQRHEELPPAYEA